MTFKELLKKQAELDEIIEAERKNGFIPRKRKKEDILFALDDEIQEWLRELPDDLNFKTWKEKEYNIENELIELTDILFFILQLFNYYNYKKNDDLLKTWKDKDKLYDFDVAEVKSGIMNPTIINRVIQIKKALYNDDFIGVFYNYMTLCKFRGFNCEDMIESYKKKWQHNAAGRINGDWTKE